MSTAYQLVPHVRSCAIALLKKRGCSVDNWKSVWGSILDSFVMDCVTRLNVDLRAYGKDSGPDEAVGVYNLIDACVMEVVLGVEHVVLYGPF